MIEPIVKASNLSCELDDGTLLLDDIDLEVAPGECILLCGRSGAGKTTLTKCLNGLIPHFDQGVVRTGNVEVCGMDPALCATHELALKVGNVFQNPKSQFFNLISDDELAFGLEVAGEHPDVIDARVNEVTRALSIERLRARNVNHLSGGEKQSLVFASAEVAEPALYILDEPTANLDHEATIKIRHQIEVALATGKTLIIAEHRLDFIADMITQAILIEQGRVERIMSSVELLSLSDTELEKMGLRNPHHECISSMTRIPEAKLSVLPGPGCLHVSDLTVERKGKTIFSPVSFTATPGCIIGIIGANGTGKTTMLRALAGLEKHALGKVMLDGVELSRRQRRRTFSYVMQDVNHQLFADSVYAECEMSLPAKLDEERARNRVEQVLNRLDLLDKIDVHPMALSGGQKQRLAIASCLLAQRSILLMDEPTSGLDYAHMIEVAQLLRGLAEEGLIVCIATHDGEFMERICDQRIEIRGDCRELQ